MEVNKAEVIMEVVMAMEDLAIIEEVDTSVAVGTDRIAITMMATDVSTSSYSLLSST